MNAMKQIHRQDWAFGAGPWPVARLFVAMAGFAVALAPTGAGPRASANDAPSPAGQASASAHVIRLNTVGYRPGAPKVASVAEAAKRFHIQRLPSQSVVYRGELAGPRHNADTDERLFFADFSRVREPGRYRLVVEGVGQSPPFKISADVMNRPFRAAMKGMYLWRCGTAVRAQHNGHVYAHKRCHMQDAYGDYIGRDGQLIDGRGGWHDAGDYNKYINNAGVTVGAMLRGWEMYKPHFDDLTLPIPGRDNDRPDYLDEVKWELDWVLKMQGPDGRVYHKISTRGFQGFFMPSKPTATRYFVPSGTTATANAVAMMAQAARVYRPYDPDYARTLLKAAKRSYQYLQQHPDYQPADQSAFETGEYASDDADERLWAAAELWQTTGNRQCLEDLESRIRQRNAHVAPRFDWADVSTLGLLTYVLSSRQARDTGLVEQVRADLIKTADALVAAADQHGYARPMGTSYGWGVNGNVARQTMILMVAYRLTNEARYRWTALDAINHLLGRNYYGRSFVTGIGHQPPRHPHDRRSEADGLDAPWPGYLVGGPHPGAKDWKDIKASYRTNEIAINWNGALIFALGAFVEPFEKRQ
jgi:endoglucanase